MGSAQRGERARIIGEPGKGDRRHLVVPDERRSDPSIGKAENHDHRHGYDHCYGDHLQQAIVETAKGFHEGQPERRKKQGDEDKSCAGPCQTRHVLAVIRNPWRG